jgi:hypothetical protein
VIYFVIDSMNNGFWRGCITPSYGNLIRRIDEHGDSQVDFGGCPILQRVSGQTKLVAWTISSKATPHEQSSSFGHGTSIKGAKGNLGCRSPDPQILACCFSNLRKFMLPMLPNSSHAKQTPNLERAVPLQTGEKRSPNIRNKLITDHLHLPTAEKVTLRTPSQAKPGVETCSAETPWPSLATSCLKHPF